MGIPRFASPMGHECAQLPHLHGTEAAATGKTVLG
jgi:hypothetical protein